MQFREDLREAERASERLIEARTKLVRQLCEEPSPALIYEILARAKIAAPPSDHPMFRSLSLDEFFLRADLYLFGATSASGIFPDCVAVGSSGGFNASGVLISDEFVLTVNEAHSGVVTSVFQGDTLASSSARVATLLGAARRADSLAFKAQIVQLTGRPVLAADPGRGFVAESCAVPEKSKLTAVGFGSMGSRLVPRGTKLYAEMTIAGITSTTITTVGRPSVCFGDSGGPAYITSASGRRALLGIIQNVNQGGTCGAGSTFTRIDSAFVDWVKQECGVVLTQDCP